MLARKKPTTPQNSPKPQLRVMQPTQAASREEQQPDSYRTAARADARHPCDDLERVAVLSLN